MRGGGGSGRIARNDWKALVLLAIFLVSGCSLAPEYTRPASPVPAEFPKGPAYAVASPAPAVPAVEVKWREFFRDDRLRKVIDSALANNRDLRTAALNIQRAQAQYRIQRADLFPVVSASGTVTNQRMPGDVAGTGQALSTTQYGVNLGVASWELDFFGRIRSLKDQALEQYLATEQAQRSARISLVSEIANAWLTLAADRENLRLARSTFESQKTAYDLIRRRQEVGASSELDLRQAETRVEAARVDIAAYTAQVARDENALNLLAGAPVAPELLPSELAPLSLVREIAPGLNSEVLLSRPDILQSENLLKAANANIGAARAAYFPRITLTSSFGTISAELSGLFKSGSETWTFAPRIDLPIFDMGARKARLEVAQADREIALNTYETAIQKAFRETADELALLGTLGEKLNAQTALVNASSQAFKLSEARYNSGIDSYLAVLDAQRTLYAAQQNLIAVRLARLSNLVAMYRVLGGGAE